MGRDSDAGDGDGSGLDAGVSNERIARHLRAKMLQ
jgi:hypothetical protein